MADTVDVETRSRMMRGIRGTNTQPELLVRRLLHRAGFRFSLNVRTLPGNPDIVLRRHRAVVLVHGCFWHGHNCPLFRLPSTRPEFWAAKIARNRANDIRVASALRANGWRTATVWECALKGRRRLSAEIVAGKLARWIKSASPSLSLTGKKQRKA
jgi:DNA mismatch endonuclease (patch repair protein)